MRGFILAAGFGTRLAPLTDHIPKALIPVCGIPLLARNLDFLYSQGITRIGVNTHHFPELIYLFKENSKLSFDIFHETHSIRGTGGALYFARDFLNNEEIFCIMNVDIISNVDMKKLTEIFTESRSICMLVASSSSGNGTILYDPISREYQGLPTDTERKSNRAFADFIGIAFYRREILDLINKDDFSILPVWKRAQESGFNVKVFVDDRLYWRDIGTPSSYTRIHFDVLDRALKIKIPSYMHIDYTKKVAYPITIPKEAVESLGEYTWIDSENLSLSSSLTRCVILKSATVTEEKALSKKILTQWGEIPFE